MGRYRPLRANLGAFQTNRKFSGDWAPGLGPGRVTLMLGGGARADILSGHPRSRRRRRSGAGAPPLREERVVSCALDPFRCFLAPPQPGLWEIGQISEHALGF